MIYLSGVDLVFNCFLQYHRIIAGMHALRVRPCRFSDKAAWVAACMARCLQLGTASDLAQEWCEAAWARSQEVLGRIQRLSGFRPRHRAHTGEASPGGDGGEPDPEPLGSHQPREAGPSAATASGTAGPPLPSGRERGPGLPAWMGGADGVWPRRGRAVAVVQ